jgi:hypothetical protein
MNVSPVTQAKGWQIPPAFPPCRFLSRPTISAAASIAKAVRRGRFAGVVVTVAATDTRWWHTLARASTGLCLVAGRRLHRATGETDLFGARFTREGQCLGVIAFSFGDVDAFARQWRALGPICAARHGTRGNA